MEEGFLSMIPLARDSDTMHLWKGIMVANDVGDAIEQFEDTGISLLVSLYPEIATRTQAQEGQEYQCICRAYFCLPDGVSVEPGDRLGAGTPQYIVTETAMVEGMRATCRVKTV